MNVSSQHRINCRTPEGTVVTRTVRRRPFPMTAAYALQTTDHKGQTYTDIATPPKYRLVVCSRRTDSVCRWLVFQSICCALAKLRMVNNQAGTSRQHIAPNVVAPVGRRNVYRTSDSSEASVTTSPVRVCNEAICFPPFAPSY